MEKWFNFAAFSNYCMMKKIKIIELETIDSTNSYLHDYSGEEGEEMTIVTTKFQTAGRGQGSNAWESERDKNITMSIKVRPQCLRVTDQYIMLEAIALAIRDEIANYVDNVTIKWPNDIYVGDRKISGTLSECSFSGMFIDECILGSGINVNQETFLSDAPNPVSLRQITGVSYNIDQLVKAIVARFEHYLSVVNSGTYSIIHSNYLSHLYRRSGYHRYEDAGGEFCARIVEVKPNGMLLLELEDGSCRSYAFKEVKFIL